MGERERTPAPAVGGSSLLVMFAVLCLTVFALLGLSTVQADGRLGEASAQATQAYYAADCQAEETLSRLRAGELPAGVMQEGNTYYYTCPISQTQALSVAVSVEGTAYEILRWQAVSTAQWAPDTTLDVWDGAALG